MTNCSYMYPVHDQCCTLSESACLHSLLLFTDKSYFQVQFGPLENCLSWGVSFCNTYVHAPVHVLEFAVHVHVGTCIFPAKLTLPHPLAQIEKSQRIESTLQTAIVDAIYQFCNSTDQKQLIFSWLRPGAFCCRSNPTMATYRSTIVSPSMAGPSSATDLVGCISSWAQSDPLLVMDYLWVSINRNCSTPVTSLTYPECDVATFSFSR